MNMTREEWLNDLARRMRPMFEAADAPLPERVRITMSLTRRSRAIGVCYDPSCSADDTFEILVRLDQHEGMDVAAILAHELTHAAVGIAAGHGPKFRRVALSIGLTGKMTATVAGDAFKQAVFPILAVMNKFPHAPLNFDGKRSGPKKQGSRLLKVECPECGYVCRVTSKWLELGAPHCPQHGEMEEV